MSNDVERIAGETFSFFVASESRATSPHRVEIDAYHFNGACSCPDFKCRKEPKLSRGAKPSDELRCRHVRKARSYFLDEILPILAKELTKRK